MKIRHAFFSAAMALSLFGASVLPAAAITAPSSTSYESYSVEQLEALIAKLQKMLAEMKKGAKCFVADRDLSLGDGEGDEYAADVRRLQDFLRERGLFSYKSTGYFGKMTRASLIAFQKSSGIPQTGAFDAASRAKAHGLYCKSAVKPKTTEQKKDPTAEKTEKPATPVTAVKSIWLVAGEKSVHWKTDGTAPQGFKVVWSKVPGPKYPNRDSDRYLYLSSSGAADADIEAFDGSGTYYVRVCEYLGGSCGTYSNEVSLTL
jgi:hypothetical protein